MLRQEDGTVLEIHPELRRPPKSTAITQHLLPIFKYHEPSYFGPEGEDSHCLLIVGGETSSLSASAYQFAHLHAGCKVHVPMCNGVNSLSVGSALGVIAFEIQRQYRQRHPIKQELLESEPKPALEQGTALVTDGKEENVSR